MADAPETRLAAAGIILAGGRSTRMGRDKASLLINGEPLLRRIVRRLRTVLDEVVVVGPLDLTILAPDVRIVPDIRPGQGPLAGLEAALHSISSDLAFVIGCDMPFVQPALVQAMVTFALAQPHADAVTLHTVSGTEPLHAVYRVSCLPAIAAQLEARDRSLMRMLARVTSIELPDDIAKACDPDALSAFNANAPEEWLHALELAAKESNGRICGS